MKLKCNDHARRVMVLPSGKVIHRNDGTECARKHLMMGTMRLYAMDVAIRSAMRNW